MGKNIYIFHNKLNTPEQFSSSSMSLQKLSTTEICCYIFWIQMFAGKSFYFLYIYF